MRLRFRRGISNDRNFGTRTNAWLVSVVVCAALAVVIMPGVAQAGDVELGWDANTESDVAGYRIYYGTASGSYQSSIDVGNVTSYTVTGLSNGLLYFFSVTAYGASDESGFSNEVNTTVVAVTDTVAPIVSLVSAPVVMFSGAQIVWTTNEASTSQVDYGTTTAYGTTTPLDANLVLAHTVTLGGLTGSTTYNYRVRSRDAAGNLAVSGNFTFTTPLVDTPPANLTAAYAYNEGSGTATADTSGSGNHATLSGATWSTACKFGGCLSFNGTSNFVETPDAATLTPGANATFEAWVLLNVAPTELQSVFNKWSQTAEDEYLFGVEPSRQLYFAWQTTGGSVWGTPSANHAFSTGTIPLNTLTHIAVVRGDATLRFYINGVLDSTQVVLDTNPFRNGTNTVRVGGQGRGGVNRFFNGRIDEARIYSRALSQAQIQYDMNTAIPSTPPDTTGPTISAVAVSAITSSGATITWTTNEPADTQVQYGFTTSYGSTTTLVTTLSTAHSVNLTSLAINTLYHFRVRSRDAVGNLTVSSDSTFTTAADGTAPSVFVTAPAAGTVFGAVTINASASDNVGVTQVQMFVDGTPVGTDTASPFSIAWDSSTVANGLHSLTAVARDLAGNSTTSSAVVVTVANDDEVVIGLGQYPGDGGRLALGGKESNAFATQVWSRIGWDAYWATNGELHTAAGDLDGDGLDEIVVGFGTGGNGWMAILDDPAHGYQWIRWIQVAWPSYNTANGAVYPAVGDVDGDGRAEIVAGLGTGGGGFVEIFDDAAAGYAHVRWVQVNWAEYNVASGETHPAVADLDGDGQSEIVLGLGTGGKGFVEIRGGAPNYEHRRWLEVLFAQYNQLNGATFPAAGDVDNDGRAEIVVGLGAGSAGWIQVFDDAAASHRHLRWLQVVWPEFNAASGETHPAVGNLDNDAAAEIVVGLGRFTGGPGGWFEILDDANTGNGFAFRQWQHVGRDTFEQSGGATYPSIAQQRR